MKAKRLETPGGGVSLPGVEYPMEMGDFIVPAEGIVGKDGEKLRIVQELVPGKQVTLAHIIARPKPIVYQKLGLDPKVDYEQAAIAILSMTPSEISIIAGDIALKTADIDVGFIDRFSGTLIFTGRVSAVKSAVTGILEYLKSKLGFEICEITLT